MRIAVTFDALADLQTDTLILCLFEDVAQFYVEYDSDHLSCYLRYTE